MKNNYYDEVLNTIQELIAQESYQEADRLIQEELAMPFVPRATEKELLMLQESILPWIGKPSVQTLLSIEELEEYLFSDIDKQALAIEDLSNRNLRDYLPLVERYLKEDPEPMLASLLIEACIKQQINNELQYNRDGLIITFIPLYLELPTETGGFKKALALLSEWVEHDNPSLYLLAVESLLYQAFLKLPEAYEEDEGKILASSIILSLYDMLGDNDQKEAFITKHNIDTRLIEDIKIT